MPLIEPSLRGGGLAVAFLIFLVTAVRGGWRVRADLLLVLARVMAYLGCASPNRLCVAAPGALPLLLGAVAFPFAFWRLASVVLEDDRRVSWLAWAGAAVMLGSGLLSAAAYLPVPASWRGAMDAVHKTAAVGFLVAAGVRAWRNREGDLIEARRRLRWVVLGGLGLYSLAVTAVEIYLQRAPAPLWLDLLNLTLIDAALLASAVFLLGLRLQARDALFEPAVAPDRPDVPQAQPVNPGEADAALVDRLAALMRVQHLYRDPELSVKQLAAALNVPEYVLRRLILVRLGHRHFASFVNDHRLREVAARMMDPELDRRPILTLALEAGFGSIGPFNRVFRERYGMTPTAFRECRGNGAPMLSDP